MKRTPALMPHQEYLKVYKLIKKEERKAAAAGELGIIIHKRCAKKVMVLLLRAQELENMMRVPAKRRYTNAYI